MEEQKLEFLQGMCRIFADAPKDVCAPVIVRDINELRREIFGSILDYSEEKSYYNKLLMEKEQNNGIAGTWLPELSPQAKAIWDDAEVIISKGQANYETLRLCGRNVYFIFLCKCEMFCKAFRVPRYTGVLVHG